MRMRHIMVSTLEGSHNFTLMDDMKMANEGFIFYPSSDDIVYKVLVGVMACLMPLQFYNEVKLDSQRYSKFFQGEAARASVSSRLGMMLLYSPAFFTACAISGWLAKGPASNITGDLVALHFAKRLLETLFVHRYSAGMELTMLIPASIYYSFCATLASVYSKPAGYLSLTSLLGLAIFFTGLLGNLYHHILLRNLRAKDGEKKYVVPHGGLFEYVACPHYMFEILIWLGIAVYGRALIGYMPAWAMLGYLGGRSVKTTEYYMEKLGEEYPANRKHMIPSVF